MHSRGSQRECFHVSIDKIFLNLGKLKTSFLIEDSQGLA